MIQRWISKRVEETLRFRRGVNLTGARQVGKTTLCEMLNLPNARHFSLDNEMTRNAAIADPKSFVAHAAGEILLIDEIQKVGVLLNAIKEVVDHDNARGQYLVTGSANLRFAKSVSDSLAGRLAHIRLRSLALGELTSSSPDFLESSFAQEWKSPCNTLNKRDVIHLAFQGGYPESRDLPEWSRRDWYRDYLEDLIKKDIRDVTQVRKLKVLKDAATELLAYTGQFFPVEDLAQKCGIAKVTMDAYLDALEAMYVFDRVPAWHKSDYDRIGRRSKWYAADSGLVANLLRWREEDVYLDGNKNGKLVETWVYHELSAQASVSGEYEITQYRDRENREIDFVVENGVGETLGIEVKAGSVGVEDFRHLKWFGSNLVKGRFVGVVLYAGDQILSFGNNFHAVPLACLG